jgi:hypothetical protein
MGKWLNLLFLLCRYRLGWGDKVGKFKRRQTSKAGQANAKLRKAHLTSNHYLVQRLPPKGLVCLWFVSMIGFFAFHWFSHVA